jgi:hypothetical protein
MTRMLCFEFPDGSGGSGWPVDLAWRPPNDPALTAGDADAAGPPPAMLAAVLLGILDLLLSAFAFRSRR